MKIMKSQIDSTIVLTELDGKRPEVMYTIRLSRIGFAGETAWAVNESIEEWASKTASVRYYRNLAEALNLVTSLINPEEQKQLLRAL